jgi:hypothetical protein
MGHTFELDVWRNCTKSPGETRIECAGRNKCEDPENIICLCSINFTSMFTTTKFTSLCACVCHEKFMFSYYCQVFFCILKVET